MHSMVFSQAYQLAFDAGETARLNLRPINWSCQEVTFQKLAFPLSRKDADQLVQMYRLCFTAYPVRLDESLVQSAAKKGNNTLTAKAVGLRPATVILKIVD